MIRGPSQGTLFIIGTPIGNLEDITLRAIRILGEVDVIAAEDTRVTAKLCRRHGITTPLTSFREQNASRAIPKLLDRLSSGQDVALVSDAGTPSISDPGVDLVAAARDIGILVIPVPGPSALATAISVAGLLGAGVRFIGFMPRSGPRRRECIRSIVVDPALVVLYEAPSRIRKTLLDLADACGSRRAIVLREMTKLHEEAASGTLEELSEHFTGEVKGEITLVLAGAEIETGSVLSEERLRELVQAELAKGRTAKDAASSLARGLGIPRKQVYEIVIAEITSRNES
ncbi:MAG: 16S rRNA (cytidine(1402)-2'-O)-methyltransferase [Proteobacteria bacterium]|nr:16S rRNA (cytidine(1402)-2'-O)-methyltransferase [Pseudomonadota bacterium]